MPDDFFFIIIFFTVFSIISCEFRCNFDAFGEKLQCQIVSEKSEEVLGWVGLGRNWELICDLRLLCGVAAPFHKLPMPSGSPIFYQPALVKWDFVL